MPLFGSGGEKLGGNGKQDPDEAQPQLPPLRTFEVEIFKTRADISQTEKIQVMAHEFGNSAGLLIFMEYVEVGPGRAAEKVASAFAAGSYKGFREIYTTVNATSKGKAH